MMIECNINFCRCSQQKILNVWHTLFNTWISFVLDYLLNALQTHSWILRIWQYACMSVACITWRLELWKMFFFFKLQVSQKLLNNRCTFCSSGAHCLARERAPTATKNRGSWGGIHGSRSKAIGDANTNGVRCAALRCVVLFLFALIETCVMLSYSRISGRSWNLIIVIELCKISLDNLSLSALILLSEKRPWVHSMAALHI